MEILRGIKELVNKIKWKNVSHFLVGIGWTLIIWEIFEDILQMGDTPYRIHHGWIGMAIIILVYLYQNKSLLLRDNK